MAIAQDGRGGEGRYLREFPATDAATRKLVATLAAKYNCLIFCYEAGPTGYGLYRLITSLGHECEVVAPSLTIVRSYRNSEDEHDDRKKASNRSHKQRS